MIENSEYVLIIWFYIMLGCTAVIGIGLAIGFFMMLLSQLKDFMERF